MKVMPAVYIIRWKYRSVCLIVWHSELCTLSSAPLELIHLRGLLRIYINHTHTHHSPLPHSHLRLHLLQQSLQRLHIRLLCRPPNPQPLLPARLRNHMKMHMVNLLVGRAAIVLQHVEVARARRPRQPLRHRQNLGELVVRDVGQFGAVVFGDYELAVLVKDRDGGRGRRYGVAKTIQTMEFTLITALVLMEAGDQLPEFPLGLLVFAQNHIPFQSWAGS